MTSFKTIDHIADLPAGRETLRVEVKSVDDGAPYIDLRRWYTAAEGHLLPTRNGVTVPFSALPALISALETSGMYTPPTGSDANGLGHRPR